MATRTILAGLAAAASLLIALPALAQQAVETIEGTVTAVNDGMINGFTHCPYRTVTIDDLEMVWACGGNLPSIGSRWRVTYVESYPSGETLVSRQRVPLN
jgi:hypothetical protein